MTMREVPPRPPFAQMNVVDRVVNFFNPIAGAQRLRARTFTAIAGSYIGASRSRRQLAGWQTRTGTADEDSLFDLPDLRERSRDLVRNAPIATGAVSGTTIKVVGTGLRPQSLIDWKFLRMTEDQAAEWQAAAEREFNIWAGSKECDQTLYQNFAELQALAFRSTLESGDCFALLPMFARGPFPYETRVHLVEADRVSNPRRTMDRPTRVAGIELDARGAAVGYHIQREHPGAMLTSSQEWDYVPAYGELSGRRNVLHLVTRLRPGQTRGVPYLAPVIEPLKQLDRYTEAEITAAVVSGLFAVFVKGAQGMSPLESAVDGTLPSGTDSTPSGGWDGKLSSGLVADLGKDEEITSVNPGRPNQAFDGFVMSVLRQVGAALDLPFEVLIKHFQSSYSASRAALLEAWHFYRNRRFWLASNFCQPVYEAVITEAVGMGRLAAPGFFADPFMRAAYLMAIWTGDGPGNIDPLKEAQAARERMAIGLTTLQSETLANDGGDYEDNLRQRSRELRMGAPAVTKESDSPDAPPPRDEDVDEELDE